MAGQSKFLTFKVFAIFAGSICFSMDCLIADNDLANCAVVSGYTVASELGHPVTLQQVVDSLPHQFRSPDAQVPMSVLAVSLTKLGLNAKPVLFSRKSSLSCPLIILLQRNKTIGGHYAVLSAIDSSNAILIDPMMLKSKITIPTEVFFASWDGYALVVSTTDHPTWYFAGCAMVIIIFILTILYVRPTEHYARNQTTLHSFLVCFMLIPTLTSVGCGEQSTVRFLRSTEHVFDQVADQPSLRQLQAEYFGKTPASIEVLSSCKCILPLSSRIDLVNQGAFSVPVSVRRTSPGEFSAKVVLLSSSQVAAKTAIYGYVVGPPISSKEIVIDDAKVVCEGSFSTFHTRPTSRMPLEPSIRFAEHSDIELSIQSKNVRSIPFAESKIPSLVRDEYVWKWKKIGKERIDSLAKSIDWRSSDGTVFETQIHFAEKFIPPLRGLVKTIYLGPVAVGVPKSDCIAIFDGDAKLSDVSRVESESSDLDAKIVMLNQQAMLKICLNLAAESMDHNTRNVLIYFRDRSLPFLISVRFSMENG